jgi:uncharacterized protein YkwD
VIRRIVPGSARLDSESMRKIVLSLVAGLALLIAPAVGQAATKASHQASSEQQVLSLLNGVRRQHGLRALTASAQLRSVARVHSDDMLQRDYFDHDSPNEAWDVRVARSLKSSLIGEDIAWGAGAYGTPEGIVDQWMHSAPHRRIILMAGMHHVGVGLSTGTFAGTPAATMATADFAA